MKFPLILFGLFCCIVCTSIFSVNAPVLQLKFFITDVIKRNPDLAAVKSRVKAASIAIPRVQTLDDPIFTVRFLNNPFGSKQEFTKQRRYRLSQKIPFIGKLRLRGEIAQHILEFVESQEKTTYRGLILQAKKLYYQLFFNQVARHINKENRDIVNRLIDDAAAVYKSGTGDQSDVLKAQIELQLLDDELLLLLSEQEMLISLINALLDRPQSYQIGNPEDYFSPEINVTYDALETIATRERSELRGLQAKIDQEEATAALARRDYYPDFTFTFMVQNIPCKQNAWGVDVSFNVPIWIEDKQKREMEEAEARALAHISELNNLRAQIRGRIRELLAKVNAAEERIKLYHTSLVPKVAQTLRANESNYLVAREDFLIVLDTRRQLQDAQLAYERARLEREVFLAELEWEIGVVFEQIADSGPLVRFGEQQQKKKETPSLASEIRKPHKRKQRKARKQKRKKKKQSVSRTNKKHKRKSRLRKRRSSK